MKNIVIFLLIGLLSLQTINCQNGNGTTTNPRFNLPGNLLIADTLNNRVIEVHRATNQIVWDYGSGNSSLCDSGAEGSLIGPTFAQRLPNGNTLIVAGGILPGASDNLPDGCQDGRVIVVDAAKNIIWDFGSANSTDNSTLENSLNMPVFAQQLPNRNILITDQGNNRIIEVERESFAIIRDFPGESADSSQQLNGPSSALPTANGDIVIADSGNNRVLVISNELFESSTVTPPGTETETSTETSSETASETAVESSSGVVETTESSFVEESSVETSAETSAESSVESSVETSAETSAESSVESSIETAVASSTAVVTESTSLVEETAANKRNPSYYINNIINNIKKNNNEWKRQVTGDNETETANGTLLELSEGLNHPTFAVYLPLLHKLVTDSANSRVVLFGPNNNVTFEYFTNSANDSNSTPMPNMALLTESGELVIADSGNHRVIVVNFLKQITYQYGIINEAGSGCGMLDNPMGVSVVGDTLGLSTPPLTF